MKNYTLHNVPKSAGPCQHSEVSIERTPEGPHYARRRCASCGMFMGWEPHPDTAARKAKLREKITALEALNLTGWNGRFISDAAKNTKCQFSPKQLEHIERIALENNIP